MSYILKTQDNGRIGADSIRIGGITYRNAAAKFWSVLIRDIKIEFPSADRMMMFSCCEGRLNRRLLKPDWIGIIDADKYAGIDISEMINDIAAEMEVTGYPSSVIISIFKDDEELHKAVIPEDCMDSGTFDYFLAWILAWGAVAEAEWNSESLCFEFTADSKDWNSPLSIEAGIVNKHLSEGLIRRELSLKWEDQTID